jgi:hypothetical protein
MKKNTLLALLGWLMLSSLYLLVSLWIQDRGFMDLEAYFIQYKIQNLTRYDLSFFRTFYFTEPALLFLGSYALSFVQGIQPSYLFNALLIGGLSFALLRKSWQGDTKLKMLGLYVLLSPVLLFAAVSGGSLALYLVFYYSFFSLLLRYIRSQSVFHLTFLSLVLGAFLLVDRGFLQLLLMLIPVFFFVGFGKAKGISGNFFAKASAIFRNESQRRKFFTGFFSSIFLVCFIPLMGILIFLIINRVFGGGFFYFETSIADVWNSYSGRFPLVADDYLVWRAVSEGSMRYMILFGLVSGLALFLILDATRGKSAAAVVVLALLYVISEGAADKIQELNLQLLSMMTGVSLAVLYSPGPPTARPTTRILGYLIPILGIFLELLYFNLSVSQKERLALQVIQQAVETPRAASIRQIEAFFKEKGQGRILADDAIFYPELSLLSADWTWEGHFSQDFQHALQQPKLYADYLLVTRTEHLLHPNDIVSTALDRLDYHGIELRRRVVYEDEFAQILELY